MVNQKRYQLNSIEYYILIIQNYDYGGNSYNQSSVGVQVPQRGFCIYEICQYIHMRVLSAEIDLLY